MNKKEAKLGGPGLDGYAYRADVYCVDCGHEIIDQIFAKVKDIPEPEAFDTDALPQPIFFGESDSRQYCGECGEFLYGPEEEEEENPPQAHIPRLADGVFFRRDQPEVRRWLRSVIRFVGPGFHPDTPFSRYVDVRTGRRSFSPEVAKVLQRDLEIAWGLLNSWGLDIYELGLEISKRMYPRRRR